MRGQMDEDLPVELQRTAERLRGGRFEASPIELDRIKQRAMAQASSRSAGNPHKGMFMRSKLLSTALAVGLLLSTASVGLAVTGNFPSQGSSGSSSSSSPRQSNASQGQYAGSEQCKTLRRENKADMKEQRKTDKELIKRLRGRENKSERKAFRTTAKSRRKQTQLENRRQERKCNRTGVA